MGTIKVNSRSPYYLVSSGAEGSAVENALLTIDGPVKGTVNSDITLTAQPINFTPVSYAWTGGAIAGSSSAELTFTETSGGEVTYGVTATDSAGNTYTASKTVSWSTNPQFEATLTVDNQISGPSQGYTIGGDLNGTKKTGETGDGYSFTTTLSLNSGYTADVALAISPSQPITGTFASADVTETTTLTGTVSRNSDYRLSEVNGKSQVIEGQTFTIRLIDANSATPNNTSIPFAITGGVSAADLQRGTLTGAFVMIDNVAEQTFEVISDNTSESASGETFILTLDNFTSVNITLTIFDQTETANPQEVLISSTGFDSANGACAATATETVYYGLFSGDTFGTGTTLYLSDALQTPYSGGGKYFKIGSNHNGRIGENNNGEITGYVECSTTVTSCTIPESSTSPNNAIVSSSFSTVAGPNGANACALTADQDVYYNGSITAGATLFTVKDSNNNLSNPFGGTDNWYKLILTCADGTPQEHYVFINSYPAGRVNSIFVCGSDIIPTTSITAAPSVTIDMATADGNKQGFAYVDQQVTLTALTQNISNPTYQWYKSTTNNDITANPANAISGETQQTLVINGSGTETQSTTGTLYYNCLVSGTTDADTNKSIQWQNRPSYATTFITSADTTNPNYGACTGSSVTLYTNRDGETAYCVASKFYSNAAGSSSPALTPGWYAFNDGTNHNLRYIDASGNPQGCVTGGCTGNPGPTPVDPTITYATIQKCDNQDNAGLVKDVVIDGLEYAQGNVLQLNDFNGDNKTDGCWQITTKHSTLSSWNNTLTSDNFVRDPDPTRPYGSCEDCVGDIQVVVETGQDPNRYYGGYRQCNNDGAPIIYYSSASPLPNVFRTSANTLTCRSKVNDDYSSTANEDDGKIENYPGYAPFNNCTTCLEGDTVTPDPIAYFRQYNNCDGGGGFVVVGSTTDLDATGHWPAVVKYSDVCYSDGGNTATTSIINITDLVTYSDCTACGYVAPTPDEPDVITTNVIRISSTAFSTITSACSGLTSNFPTTLYYTGTLGDGTQLYSSSDLTRVYAPASSDFYLSEDGYYFKIGTGTGNPRGEIYTFGQCGNII
jgi:hypothetical protein